MPNAGLEPINFWFLGQHLKYHTKLALFFLGYMGDKSHVLYPALMKFIIKILCVCKLSHMKGHNVTCDRLSEGFAVTTKLW